MIHTLSRSSMIDGREWLDQAACAPCNLSEENRDLDWYSSDQDTKYRARAVCQSKCPVRKECITDALRNFDIWGIHGGVDDYEIRRALSVDANAEPLARNRAPRCPFCFRRNLSISGKRVKGGYETVCNDCGLVWNIAVIPSSMKRKRTTT